MGGELADNLNVLKSHLAEVCELEASAWTLLEQNIQFRVLKPKQHFINKGDRGVKMAFMLSGIMRIYNTENKRELTHEIFYKPRFVTNMISFLDRSVSDFCVDAIADSVIAIATSDIVFELIQTSRSFQAIYHKSMEDAIAGQQLRIDGLLIPDLKIRYSRFLEEYKEIAYYIPQKCIASYLGITPEALCRLKKSLLLAESSM